LSNLDSIVENNKSLLQAVAEELKIPLTKIARYAELTQSDLGSKNIDDYLELINRNTASAIQLIDSYLIGLSLATSNSQLNLSPISVGSVLNDAAHELSPIAKDYNVKMELNVSGRQRLVMSNKAGLKAAFISIGSTFITGQNPNTKKSIIRLTSFPREHVVVAGVFADHLPLNRSSWKQAQNLIGRSRKPINTLSGGTAGAGLFVADSIIRAMSHELKSSKHQSKPGLAVSLAYSQQLHLV